MEVMEETTCHYKRRRMSECIWENLRKTRKSIKNIYIIEGKERTFVKSVEERCET
jgi:hypothetical protein